MGETLPALVDGHYIISEQFAIDHISGDLESEEKEMLVWLDENVGALISEIKLKRGRDMLEVRKACGAHFPTAWELMIKDAVKKICFRYGRLGDNKRCRLSSEEIIVQLEDSLGTANSKLAQNDGYLLANNISSATTNGAKVRPFARSSPAEAVLFGYLCEAINSDIIDITEWEALSSFLTSVLEDYFQMATVPPSLEEARRDEGQESFRVAMIEWRRSTDILLTNAFVRQLPNDNIVVKLLQQRNKYDARDEDEREASWRRLLATTSTAMTIPENDCTSSHWVNHFRFSLQPLRRTFKKLEGFLWRLGLTGFNSPLDEGDEEEERAALMSSETITIYPGGGLFMISVGVCFVGYAILVGLGRPKPRP